MSKMEHLSKDFQKFRRALRQVRLFQPTGVDEKHNGHILIANHIRKCDQIAYDAKDCPHMHLVNCLAYTLFLNIPKYSEVETPSVGVEETIA